MFTYHIITIGCQMNKSDSERVAGVLEKQGYKMTDDKYRADLVVVNTCGVRQSAEDRIYGLIPEIKRKSASRRKKTKIIVTGCLVYRKDVRRRLENYVDEWMMITEMTNDKFPMTNECQISNTKYHDYLKIIPKYESKLSAFVPIGNGCNNFCSYCVVPYARGREVWRPANDILAEVRGLVKQGYKEIVFIAQNVNSYESPHPLNSPLLIRRGGRGEVDFAELLIMVNNIEGDFRIKFATSHPKDMSDKLIKAMASCEKVCRQVHLPAQAGDDEVLKKMNRKYKHEDDVRLVRKIRKQLNPPRPPLLKGAIWSPPVSITTDIIVGFPGETKKQFNNTVKLCREIKFDKAYIARYSPRPGTAAAKLKDDVSPQEKKRRWRILENLINKPRLKK